MGRVEQLLAKARSEESVFRWLVAADAYSEALSFELEPLGKATVQESLGFAFYKAAMQAETSTEFKRLMRQSISSYHNAARFHNLSKGVLAVGQGIRCKAMASYASFWADGTISNKKKDINQAWRLTQEALKVFSEVGDGPGVCRTLVALSLVVELANAYEARSRVRERNWAEVLKHARRVALCDPTSLSGTDFGQACAVAAVLLSHNARLHSEGSKEYLRLRYESQELWGRAKGLAPSQTILELCNTFSVSSSVEWTRGNKDAIAHYERSLEEAERTKDNLSIGIALDHIANLKNWELFRLQDPESIDDRVSEVIRLLNESKAHFTPMSFVSPREGAMWGGAPESESYWLKALLSTGLSRKRRFLEEGEEHLADLMKRARLSGYPNAIRYAHHVSSKILSSLAKLEGEVRPKKRLLQRAIRHRIAEQRVHGKSTEGGGRYLFGEGINLGYLGDLKLELSKFVGQTAGRIALLEEATDAYGKCIAISLPAATFYETMGDLSYFAPLANRQVEFARSLYLLFEASGDRAYLRKSTEEFRAAALSFSKAGPTARAAECYWRAGKAHDFLGQHDLSASEFDEASAQYRMAAEKVPRLGEFYSGLARYMDAWSHIENAKLDHSRDQYSSAKAHYEKASELHQTTGKWAFLAPNYRAWAAVELGESLSRKDKVEEAIRAFSQAKNLFQESKSLVLRTTRGLDSEELEMVEQLIRATDQRERYCQARILIEDARRFANEGDHQLSAKNYGLAAGLLGNISLALESGVERREIDYVRSMSEAWQMMERAEAEVHPDLFRVASRLFEKAKAKAPTERSKMVVLGHSEFSMALWAGRKFLESGTSKLQESFNHALRHATDFYLKAGLDNAAEYAKATRLLVDAHGHLSDADRERDLEKKAKNYSLAERMLEAAADSFSTAQQRKRRDEVLALLKIARGERVLAGSLVQLLQASSLLSSTTTLTAPQPTHEEAVGVKRFEGADVRAELSIDPEELKVGGNLSVEIELVNTGRRLAQLVKIDNLIPNGFEIAGKPTDCRLSGRALDLKGKMLGPLQTEELAIQLRPVVSGVASISPKVMYIDESGDVRSFKLVPAEVIVAEPYVPEWMKRTLPLQIPSEFMFETERAKRVFECLAKAFSDDYVVKGLFAERAGWRSLGKLLRETLFPSSAFYGTDGQKGPVLRELERLGLVEMRLFPGERGRGGMITKARIAYGNVVLHHVPPSATTEK